MTPGREALIEAMRIEQARIYSRTCPEPARAIPAVTQQPGDEHYGRGDVTALITAMRPAHLAPVPNGRLRVRIEQAIARGHDDQRIARDLDIDAAQVVVVHRALDQAAAS